MRDLLNEPFDDEDIDVGPDRTVHPFSCHEGHGSIADSLAIFILGSSQPGSWLQHPNLPQLHQIYLVYTARVEPVTKVLHAPALRKFIMQETEGLACSPGSRGWEALRFAIYLLAVTSMDAAECLARLGEEKSVLVSRYQSCTEAALTRADIYKAEELSIVQAMSLYLVCDQLLYTRYEVDIRLVRIPG